MKRVTLFIVIIMSALLGFYSATYSGSPNRAEIERNNCTGCYSCVEVCPTKAIKEVAGKAIIIPDKCVGCGLCIKECPENIIYMEGRN